jgi:hypothetical protein
LSACHEDFALDNSGEVARYIPELGKAGLALRHRLAYFSDILNSLTEPDPSLAERM